MYPRSKVISFPSQVMVDHIFLLGISHPKTSRESPPKGILERECQNTKALSHYASVTKP